MKNQDQMRQGDLLFERCDSIPAGLKKVQNGVLAYGEVTGHSHQVADLSTCDVFVDEEGFHKYRPTSLKQLVNTFREYK